MSDLLTHAEYQALAVDLNPPRSPFIDGKEYPDFRVVLYVNGEWENEWGNLWSKGKAAEVAKRLNKRR